MTSILESLLARFVNLETGTITTGPFLSRLLNKNKYWFIDQKSHRKDLSLVNQLQCISNFVVEKNISMQERIVLCILLIKVHYYAAMNEKLAPSLVKNTIYSTIKRRGNE